MTKYCILFLLLLFACSFEINSQVKAIESFTSIDAVDFQIGLQQHDNSVLIDVRTKREYRKERIHGSILAEKREELLVIADTLDKEQPVFVYCDEGDRSFSACIILTDLGFKNVYNLERGLIDWKKQGYPLDD